MGLTKYKLGELIEETYNFNNDLQYDMSFVRGISNTKQITTTKADVNNTVIQKFYIIHPGEFIYNPRTTRMGNKVGLGYNNCDLPLLFTFNNIAFRIKASAKKILISDYLYMYYNRSEFDRYAISHSWGSATELFTFEEMCNVYIELPPLSVQQKYVDIYKAMVANQQSYERGLDDLKLTIDIMIDKLKNTAHRVRIGALLREVDNRNTDNSITNVQGININKQFMPTVANTTGTNLANYKVVTKGQFAFSGMQTGRDMCIRIALFDKEEPIIISPAYTVLQTSSSEVIPEYIMIWFSRKESDRFGWFLSDASIRSNLDLDSFFDTKIPLPDISIQKAIAEMYNVYTTRKQINEQLKEQIKNICPILIKGSLEEEKKVADYEAL